MSKDETQTASCEMHQRFVDGWQIEDTRARVAVKRGAMAESASNGCQICRLFSDALTLMTNLESHSVLTSDNQFSKRRFAIKTSQWGSDVLELYALPGQKLPELLRDLPVRGEVPRRQDDPESLALVKKWLQSCSTTHKLCGSDAVVFEQLPTRLVDVGTNDKPRIRLIESREDLPRERETSGDESWRYLALSHCWGSCRPLCRTTPETYEANRQEISWASLPKTFQDAIIATRALDFRYIWIDSICVRQEDKEDWAREAGRMQDYYSNAYCTLAATWASDDDQGLFCDRDPKYDAQILHTLDGIPIQARMQTPHFHVPIPSGYPDGARDKGVFPLLQRAWVYQERLLSRRVVYYTQQEIMWECGECTTCQCYSTDQAFPDPGTQPEYAPSAYPKITYNRELAQLASGDATELSRIWRQVVTIYTGLGLTFGQDKFPALSGITTDMLHSLRIGTARSAPGADVTENTNLHDGLDNTPESLRRQYNVAPVHRDVMIRKGLLDFKNMNGSLAAGLLRSDMLCHLLWAMGQYPSKRCPRPSQWRAPSWSWASVDSPVFYYPELENSSLEQELASVTGKKMIYQTPDRPFGELLYGCMTLRGKAIEVTLSASMNRTVHTLDFPKFDAEHDSRVYSNFALDYVNYDAGDWQIGTGDVLTGVMIGVSQKMGFLIMLRPAVDHYIRAELRTEEGPFWNRIGMTTLSKDDFQRAFAGIAEEREFHVE